MVFRARCGSGFVFLAVFALADPVVEVA